MFDHNKPYVEKIHYILQMLN